MSYAVKEIYYSIQGEGAHVGRPAVFLRFTSCNLWSGLERDRATAICTFCDTDFVGTDGPAGGIFHSSSHLAAAVDRIWQESGVHGHGCVVCTGGEPLLQLDPSLIESLHALDFDLAVETNGTRQPPAGIDWLCVSPKAGADLRVTHGNALKLVYPQKGAEPELYEQMHFTHFFLQPKDGDQIKYNTQRTIRYCSEHPQWRLSLQRQKMLGIA